MTGELAKTSLHGWHAAHGARLVDFAGWSMPVQYSSIVAEHNATRNAVGLFDVSHMGRLRIAGPDAARFLDHLLTRRVTDMLPGKVRYALVTNETGGILDDVLVYCVQPADQVEYRLIVNASNRETIVAWLAAHQKGHDVSVADRTSETAMIAVQGPQAVPLAQKLVDVDIATMKYYTSQFATIQGSKGAVSRTGYTGEDGCELIIDAQAAESVWTTLIDGAVAIGGMAAGLGARDTLRLEAAMPLYGHELSEAINPVQAGLDFALNLEGREFIGRDAIARLQEGPPQPRRVGLELTGRRVPRQGCAVFEADKRVGEVSSGTFSPTLGRPIAMAYVEPDSARQDADLTIDIRGHNETARLVPLPFYKRPSKT